MKFREIEEYSSWVDQEEVQGDIRCNTSILTSLDGSPRKVYGDFTCDKSSISDLVGGPVEVTRVFAARDTCTLSSLEGVPKSAEVLQILKTAITSLKPLQESKFERLYVEYCKELQVLDALPSTLRKLHLVYCSISKLEPLGCKVTNSVNLNHNKITSLVDIHKTFPYIGGDLTIPNNPIEEGWMYLFFIKGLTFVNFNNDNSREDVIARDIINSHIEKGKAGLVPCQLELLRNGLDKYARI